MPSSNFFETIDGTMSEIYGDYSTNENIIRTIFLMIDILDLTNTREAVREKSTSSTEDEQYAASRIICFLAFLYNLIYNEELNKFFFVFFQNPGNLWINANIEFKNTEFCKLLNSNEEKGKTIREQLNKITLISNNNNKIPSESIKELFLTKFSSESSEASERIRTVVDLYFDFLRCGQSDSKKTKLTNQFFSNILEGAVLSAYSPTQFKNYFSNDSTELTSELLKQYVTIILYICQKQASLQITTKSIPDQQSMDKDQFFQELNQFRATLSEALLPEGTFKDSFIPAFVKPLYQEIAQSNRELLNGVKAELMGKKALT